MNIKKEYKKKTKKYLMNMNNIYIRRELVGEELEDIYNTIAAVDYSNNIQSTTISNSVENSILKNEDRINKLKCEITTLDKKIESFNKIKSNLSDSQLTIIEYKYINKNNNRSYSYLELQDKTNYSIPMLKKIHKELIEKIAYLKFGEESINQ